MRPVICLMLLSLLVGCASSGSAAPEGEASGEAKSSIENEDDKILYATGLAVSRQLAAAGFTEAEVEMINAGLTDGLLRREPKVDLEVYGPKIQGMVQAKIAAAAQIEKQESQAYVDEMAKEEGAQMTESGAIYFEIEPGTGASPAKTDRVKVHYHGYLRDGTVFDSSVDRGEPVTFSLGSVVACFSEGIQMMKVGGKAKLVCPSETAYGDRGSPPKIKGGETINFDVELIEIVEE